MNRPQSCRATAANSIALMLVWAFLSVFTAYSSFAPGTMPKLQPGGLTVVLCTGGAPRSITVDETGTPAEAQDIPCPWVTHVQVDDAVVQPVFAVHPLRTTSIDAAPASRAASPLDPAFNPSYPRAPPAFL